MSGALKMSRERTLSGAVVLVGVLTLGACASMPPPTSNLQAAHRAIVQAQEAKAGRYAPKQMIEARAKLASANDAVSAQRMTKAARLANESRADAELAASMTAEARARAVNEEMVRSTKILIEEMQRSSSGDTP
ncbi:MAG: DUF4398 domain-containing protein [Steroidobacteraceae bacterium]